MQRKLYTICSLVILSMFISVGAASVQSFESDIGTIEINLPYTVESGDISRLVMPGTTKPIISINLFDSSSYKDLESFAESLIGPGHTFDKMTTNAGKPMLFYAEQTGTDADGNSKYTFRGYIDYTEKKGKYISIHAPNNVRYQSETIATYTKDQFAEICQSFIVK